MVILFKLATLLLAVLIVIAFSSIFASHVDDMSAIPVESRTKMELVGSSNFSDVKVHTKRQSAFPKKLHPLRDSKLYLDEPDRDTYLDEYRTSQSKPAVQDGAYEQNYSSSAPIYRSHHHGGYYTIPGTGYGYGGATNSAGHGHSMVSGFGNPFGGFGGIGGSPAYGGNGGTVVGHSFSVLDPLFLMITLSFILFLVNSILGIVDRIKLPVVRARSGDTPIQSDLGIEIIDSLIYEIRASLDKYDYEHKQDFRVKEN